MVPPSSSRVSRVPLYSGSRRPLSRFAYRAFTFFGLISQIIRLRYLLPSAVLNPKAVALVWPLSISLAATLEIAFAFFSCDYLDVSVRRVSLPYPILFRYGRARFSCAGFPIRISAARWMFAPPRGFSQLTASFFGSQRPGIRPLLFLA